MNSDSTSDEPVKPLRSRIKEATRDAILESAEALFGGKGLHEARMEEVAASAGVSVGTLYNYFGDRAALLEALFEARRTEVLARMDGVVEQVKGRPLAEQLEAFIGGTLGYMEEHRRLFALLLEEELRRVGGPKKTTLRLLSESAARLVHEGVEQGALRADGADLFSSLLVGLFRTVFARALNRGEAVPLTAHTAALTRFFLEGAGRRPTPPADGRSAPQVRP